MKTMHEFLLQAFSASLFVINPLIAQRVQIHGPFGAATIDPLVWFCPLDPLPRPEVGYGGSPQYMDLFSATASWQQAASRVKVFKIYPQWIMQTADSTLQKQFSDLVRRGIALALEFGVLTESSQCGIGVEGFGGKSLITAARRIKQNGGILQYVAMDEPIYFSTMYSGTNACHWTVNQMAASAAENIRALLAEFPNVKIGDIEPVPASPPDWLARYQDGIRAFHDSLGFALAFFDADVMWSSGTTTADLSNLRSMLAGEGVPLGIIYNGDFNDSPDSTWIKSAEQHMTDVELDFGTPDHVIFQSWHAYPKKLLPEVESDSFTWLINRYFRQRTTLTATLLAQSLSGRIVAGVGQALFGAQVSVSATPLTGSGIPGTYLYQGIVPVGTQKFVFGARVNLECNCSGSADFRLTDFRYEPTSGGPIIRDFTNQLNGWGLSIGGAPGALAQIEGSSLHVIAQPGQTILLNSAPIARTDSGSYQLRVNAQVAPKSQGSGYFTLIFLGASTEISRVQIPLKAIKSLLSTATSDTNGQWMVGLPSTWQDTMSVESYFGGSSNYWPARSVQIWTKGTSNVDPQPNSSIPAHFVLEQNFPNPFNPSTTISFSLPSKSLVSLKVFDALGREVSILVSGELAAGNYALQWNTAGLTSGVYFYRLDAGSYSETKKLVLLR